MRVLSVFGTRPEAIKMAPVVKALAGAPGIDSGVCVTAQHRAMLDQVLDLFGIDPEFDLDIMRDNQDLAHITSAVLDGMIGVLDDFQPDRILVHGDTTTAFAASLAAFYRKIPVGHVEAGLRTGDVYAPFPEEMNRRLSDAIADMFFAPTETARATLIAEGAADARIFVTGNTVIDALLSVTAMLRDDAMLRRRMEDRFQSLDRQRRMILVTGHRRENFGPGFEAICAALAELAGRNDVEIVYPVHLNPNVSEPVHQILDDLANIHLPVVVMRDVTERPEAVEAGTVKLVGTDRDAIVGECARLLDDEAAYRTMSRAHNPYGDGTAAKRIVKELSRGL